MLGIEVRVGGRRVGWMGRGETVSDMLALEPLALYGCCGRHWFPLPAEGFVLPVAY